MIEYPVTIVTRGGAVETTVTASVLATADAVIDMARRNVGSDPAAFVRGEVGHTNAGAAGPARAVADGGHATRTVQVPVAGAHGECWHAPGGCAGHLVETIDASATELVDERELRPCQSSACQAAGIDDPVRCDGCGVAVFDPEAYNTARYCPDCHTYVEAHPDARDHEPYALREPNAPVPVADGGESDPKSGYVVSLTDAQLNQLRGDDVAVVDTTSERFVFINTEHEAEALGYLADADVDVRQREVVARD